MTKNDEPTRVMLLIDCIRKGGAESQLIELAKHIDRKRFEPHVVIYRDVNESHELKKSDIPVHLIEKKFRYDITFPFRLAKFIREKNIEIIHSHMIFVSIWARLAGWLSGAKVITYLLNTNYIPFWYFLEKIMSSLDAITMVNSYAGRDEYLQNYKSDRLKVVHNCIDMNRVPEIKHSPKGSEGPWKIVVIARIKPQKNHFCLIRAIKRIKDEFPRLKVELWGSAVDKAHLERIQAYIEEMEVSQIVEYKGLTDNIYKVLAEADLSVLSSDWEGLPNSTIESLACGVPVISTDVADMKELVIQGKTGWLYPKNDDEALARLIGEYFRMPQEHRDVIMREGVCHARANFDVSNMVKKIEGCYEKVLEN